LREERGYHKLTFFAEESEQKGVSRFSIVSSCERDGNQRGEMERTLVKQHSQLAVEKM
jgi:hypothetical protein